MTATNFTPQAHGALPDRDRRADESLLTGAFRRLRSRLLALSAAISGADSAEDVLQDAFLRLWTRPKPLASTDEAERLLTTTVRNASLDLHRTQMHLDTSRDVDALPPTASAPSVEPDGEILEREDAFQQRFQQVESLIRAHLSPTARQILLLRDREGRSFGEIAQQLGMTEDAVRMHVSRARRTIRTLWMQQNP